jgi:hypothetical protein
MRRVLGMLVLAAWLALAAVVVTAIPAAASPGGGSCVSTERRNVGGTGPAATCTCMGSPLERRNVGGTGPAATCTCMGSPLERRNVGGTGPAAGTCHAWLDLTWLFPRSR